MTLTRFEIPGYKGGFTLDMSEVQVESMPAQSSRKERDVPLTERRVIAWDGEGMKLSGNDNPQHYVMFGCSAEPQWVRIGRDLKFMELLEYIIAVGERYPSAVHVGYGFRYDDNMIIKSMPEKYLRAIKQNGEVRFRLGNIRWRIAHIPGKSFRVTKRWSTGATNKGKRQGDGYTSVKIDDMVSFFAMPFLDACEDILKEELSDEDKNVIKHGKESRKDNLWDDLSDVKYYWNCEIRLMQRMAEKFRDAMFNAGIMLKDWYGPGAIASFLINKRKLRNHLQNTPVVRGDTEGSRALHVASKTAYAGGRFELFRVGRVRGPVFGLDINSAYPYALSLAPSLGLDHGEWVYVSRPTVIEEFGVYRITYRHGGSPKPIERAAMPLFHRDHRGSISFPQICQGWYWSPEARAAQFLGQKAEGSVTIHEGWVWRHDNTRPFEFLQDMYAERQRIGKKNVMSKPYKLGPNSMYGKLAQRVGWDEKNKLPPKSHCLPLAGWITSKCRASLFYVMAQMPMHHLVAVETDGIYTTMDPDRLNITVTDDLGDWELTEYKEMLYLQNGVYHRYGVNGKTGELEWMPPKARGLDIASVAQPIVESYLRSTEPGDFPPLEVRTKERFIGLNAAYARGKGVHIREHLGKWEPGKRDMEPGGKGKRAHMSSACRQCSVYKCSPWDEAHELVIRSNSMGEMSAPHSLPWEKDPVQTDTEKAREFDNIEEDLIPYEYA